MLNARYERPVPARGRPPLRAAWGRPVAAAEGLLPGWAGVLGAVPELRLGVLLTVAAARADSAGRLRYWQGVFGGSGLVPTPRAAAIARAANVRTAMDNLDNSARRRRRGFWGSFAHPCQRGKCVHALAAHCAGTSLAHGKGLGT